MMYEVILNRFNIQHPSYSFVVFILPPKKFLNLEDKGKGGHFEINEYATIVSWLENPSNFQKLYSSTKTKIWEK